MITHEETLDIDYNKINWLLLAMELLISCIATNDHDFLEAQQRQHNMHGESVCIL